MFTRSEDGVVGSRLELGKDCHWPGSPNGFRLLTGNVLGYHEVFSIHVAVVTPAEGEVIPLDFGDANSLKLYIFSLKSFGCGDANSSKALIFIYIVPEALWILEKPSH